MTRLTRSRDRYLSPAEAARHLGVSAKALRLYEQRRLIRPMRTEAGWRRYGPADIERAAEVVALRSLGLSIGQIARVLAGDGASLEAALAAHADDLVQQIDALRCKLADVRALVDGLRAGDTRGARDIVDVLRPQPAVVATLDLPWPWGGEPFAVQAPRALNFIVGPLASGKTQLAKRIADVLPDAGFVGLERIADRCAPTAREPGCNEDLNARVDSALTWLLEEGAEISEALVATVTALNADAPAVPVIDLIEHGLNERTQEALIAHLHGRGTNARAIYMITRSSAVLDLAACGPDEAIIFCPANHSPPTYVMPHPGAPGYEGIATCLASPDVRHRSAGVVAVLDRAAYAR